MNENTPFSELYEYLKGGDGVIVATAARLIVNKKGTEAIYMIFNALNLGQLRNRPTDDPDLRVCIAGCAVAISLLGDKAIPILEKNATLDITKLDNSIPIVISMGALNQIGGNNAKAALDYIKEIQGSTMRQYNF
ncbi:MAG TPA: hypothetical protein VIK55_18815 [Paludibacter sp.]